MLSRRTLPSGSLIALAPFAVLLLSCSSPNTQGEFPNGASCTGGACVQPGSCVPGRASAQFRMQTAPPDVMNPGQRAHVSVTFDNCSGQTWTASDFSLVPQSPSDATTWSLPHVALPADVPNGAEVTIPFDVTAPQTSGSVAFAWAVDHQGVETFQEHSPTVNVRVLAPANCALAGPPARFRMQSAPPAFVAPGAHVHATVTFANCSTETWTRTDGFRLGSQADTDNTTWGTSRIELPEDVPPENEVTIPIDVVAPSDIGTYRFSWGIVHDGVRWYDESSPVTNVAVLRPANCPTQGPPARFVSEDAPDTLDPGQHADVRVSYANCSGRTWGTGDHLGPADDETAASWGQTRVALPNPVGDGFEIDIPFSIQAPGNSGSYSFRWSIQHDGAGPLDEATPARTIAVRCIPSCGDHNCGGDGCGGSCGTCQFGGVCDGAHCQDPLFGCGELQWWNSYITYEHVVGGWNDTDLGVSSNTPVALRHASRLDNYGVYAWGYMPEFTDLVTGDRFRFLHLRPQHMWATNIGQVYDTGYVVGLSGGDTYDTGLGVYSTGAHLCVQTLVAYRTAFPAGRDACR